MRVSKLLRDGKYVNDDKNTSADDAIVVVPSGRNNSSASVSVSAAARKNNDKNSESNADVPTEVQEDASLVTVEDLAGDTGSIAGIHSHFGSDFS